MGLVWEVMQECICIWLFDKFLYQVMPAEGAVNDFGDGMGGSGLLLSANIVDGVSNFRSDANASAKGGIYLIEFRVDDFGIFVPVVDVDPHL